jgi:hypothetical protein
VREIGFGVGRKGPALLQGPGEQIVRDDVAERSAYSDAAASDFGSAQNSGWRGA